MLAGLDYKSAPNAFNVWLKLPEGTGRADLMGRMAGRHIGIMPSDGFTVLGEADEHVRVCLGGSISREDLRREVAAPVEDREGDGDDDEAERREHDVPVEGGGAGGAR